MGYVCEFDVDILQVVYGGLEIEVLDVKSYKFGSFAGNDAVE